MIYLRLRSRQPLCVADELAQGVLRRSLQFIPGSALRGALATALRAQRPHIDQNDFSDLMLAHSARFYNFYPLTSGGDYTWPLPNTARTCKIYNGFAEVTQGKSKPGHGVRDLLFAYLRYRLSESAEKIATLPPQTCRHDNQCDLALEPYGGFYAGYKAGDYHMASVNLRQITQTAIDPHRESARPSNLFMVEAMEEGQDFAGYIALGDPQAEADFCREVVPEQSFLRIGYGRTRGLGLMEVVRCRVTTMNLWEDNLCTRLQKFNDIAQQRGCLHQGECLFSITMLSDTILLDPFFRHTAQLDGPLLAQEIHAEFSATERLLMFADTRQISGWSTPHGLPLPADWAVTSGSTFVFRTELSITRLAEVLVNVEHEGIGERRGEGFGQIVVCHPFHQEIEPV